MGKLISIDPGNWSGLAMFRDGELVHAEVIGPGLSAIYEFIKCDHLEIRYGFPDYGIIEIPQIYAQRFWKGDPNDLVQLSHIAGLFGAWLSRLEATVTTTRPHDWKGARPKKADNDYTLKCLATDEINRLPKLPKSKMHNVLDAVGIGLWYLKRR